MTPIVSIIMGSTSDLPVMEKAAQLLNDLHVPFEMNAFSAHRTPEAVEEFAKNAHLRGIKVIITAAGMAAHLPGSYRSIDTTACYWRSYKIIPRWHGCLIGHCTNASGHSRGYGRNKRCTQCGNSCGPDVISGKQRIRNQIHCLQRRT